MSRKFHPLPKCERNKYDDDAIIYVSDNEFLYNFNVKDSIVEDIENREFQVYSGYYTWEKGWESPKIFLLGRGKKSGKKKIKIQNFLPYCYVYNKQGKYKSYDGKKVEKILFKNQLPRKVAQYRKKEERKDIRYVPLEADVRYILRFMIDCGDFFKTKKYIEPKVAIIDIETDFPVSDDIISFALNSEDELYFNSKHLSSNYKELLLDLLNKIKKYDVITGWNSKLFDIPHIKQELKRISKCKTVDIDPNPLHHTSTIDSMIISKKMYAKQLKGGWSLDNAGARLCGIGKRKEEEHKMPRQMGVSELLEYNVIDVVIPELIDDKLGGMECHLQLSRMLGCSLEETEITAVINDISMLKAYHKKGIVLKSRPPHWLTEAEKKNKKSDDYDYKAAEPDARPGVYENVVAVDISAAYPSAVLAINASCETKCSNGYFRAPDGIRFKEGYSVFIEELQRLMEERYKVKRQLKDLKKGTSKYKTLKRIDFALKTQVAAFSHGIFGWASSRMRDTDVADAICSTVRTIINLIKYKVDKMGHKWIYSHTDSVYFIAPKSKAKELTTKLNRIINDFAKLNKWKFSPKLDFEGFYPKAYVHSPARNVMVEEDGEWNTTGCNFMRSETPKPLADIEETLIRMKLDGESTTELLIKLKEMLIELPDYSTNKLGLEKPLKKPVEKYGRKLKDGTYGGFPYHIKAVMKAEKEFGLDIPVGGRYMIIPIISHDVLGVRVLKWNREWMAYDIDGELPECYEVDFEEYLRSNLWGKIYDLFELEPDEIEELAFDSQVRTALNIRDKPDKEDKQMSDCAKEL